MGNVDRFRNRFEMPVQTLLCRAVVVGRYDKCRIGSGGLCGSRHTDACGGAVCAGAGDNRYAMIGNFDGHAHQSFPLHSDQGRRFSRRATRDQPLGAFGYLPLDEIGECALVDPFSVNGVTSAVIDPLNIEVPLSR